MSEAKTRILLVDDDGDLRRSLGEALEEAGYLVTASANGHDALAVLRGTPRPDVILLDLLMPVMNGWQFCQAKRADPATAPIPVIAMSAAVSSDPRSPYYIEVDDFIAKPLELDELLSKLEPWRSRSSGRAPGPAGRP
jgi:CheY-like chemotaxis protein